MGKKPTRHRIEPGPFQLRVLGAVAGFDGPGAIQEIAIRLAMRASSKNITRRIEMALDRLLRLGYVEERYDPFPVYEVTAKGRRRAEEES